MKKKKKKAFMEWIDGQLEADPRLGRKVAELKLSPGALTSSAGALRAEGARLAASKVRDDFADTLNRVAYGRERIVIHRRGKDTAALVPIEDLALIEKLDDAVDVREAKKVLANMKRKDQKSVPYERARRELGFKVAGRR